MLTGVDERLYARSHRVWTHFASPSDDGWATGKSREALASGKEKHLQETRVISMR